MRVVLAALAVVVLGFLFAAIGAALPADQPGNPTLSIARWQGDRAAAVSFTFDDGLQCHRDLAAPILAEYGFRGTFYVVAGKAREHTADPFIHDPKLKFDEGKLSWQEIREIASMGHEIGNHSFAHPFLPRLDPAQLRHEVQDAALLIREKTGVFPLTFACPYNEMNTRVRSEILSTHIAIRQPWTDWGGPAFSGDAANDLIDQAVANGAWLVPMIHGIDGGFLPLSSDVFRENLTYLKEHDAAVWVDTFANVARYVREREDAAVKVQSISPHGVTFTVDTPTLDDGVFSVPLTIRLRADDEDVTEVKALRDGQLLPVHAAGSVILVDAPPGAGPITVTWE